MSSKPLNVANYRETMRCLIPSGRYVMKNSFDQLKSMSEWIGGDGDGSNGSYVVGSGLRMSDKNSRDI